MDNIQILKENGEFANFDRVKLFTSLSKSGALDAVAEEITAEIESTLFNGTTTKEIYKKTFDQLKKHTGSTAARYKLKKGIMELGPTGFPFEIFIGELLKHQGYSVKTGVIVQGFCVQHELDVVAEKDNNHFMIECKFHSSFNTKCSVKIPLYIQSRFLDIEKLWVKQEGHRHKFHQGWVVNNTRFSEDAIQYAECMGLKLLGWDYPKGESLGDLIRRFGLYPITCLTTLKKSEKQALLNQKIVLCKQLCEDKSVLNQLNLDSQKIISIQTEAYELCKLQL
jgi:hypothetical protein